MAKCKDCFHSYVCEKFNENRNEDNEKCHFYNDHFVSTADVAEVRHGEWLPTKDKNKKQCSRCDVLHLIAQYPYGDANYCPNCGAKMDGKDKEVKL